VGCIPTFPTHYIYFNRVGENAAFFIIGLDLVRGFNNFWNNFKDGELCQNEMRWEGMFGIFYCYSNCYICVCECARTDLSLKHHMHLIDTSLKAVISVKGVAHVIDVQFP